MRAIVAFDKNLGMGYKGGLPWPKISDDFKWFKEYTLDQCIIMGRKTFDSVGILARRNHLVLSRGPIFQKLIYNGAGLPVVIFTNLDGLLKNNKTSIVCGGAEIYKELIPFCNEICITHVNGIYEADTIFPFTLDEINDMFPNNELVRELDGGHKVIKYSKK